MLPDSDSDPLVPYRKLPAQCATSVPEVAHCRAVGGLKPVCAVILAVELAERLCYYTFAGSQEFLLESLGYSVGQSAGLNSGFSTLCYMWPLVGGYLADTFWGRYATIIRFTSIYILGALMCAIAALPGEMRSKSMYMFGSMGFLAIGTGGIKPNISNFGADQFDVSTAEGRHQQEAFYTQFYVAINVGALLSYGGLTTLCTHGGFFIPRDFGYFAAYGIGTAFMGVALVVFISNKSRYFQKPHKGNALLGVILHVSSAAQHGSCRAILVCVGCPLLLVGVTLTVVVSFYPDPRFATLTFWAIVCGLGAVGVGCTGDLSWMLRARRNRYGSRQQSADFLRILPMLITASLSFNALYNCMGFWYQQQACQMDLRVSFPLAHSVMQLNGSFFNIADCIAIVGLAPVVTKLNSFLAVVLGRFSRHEKLLFGNFIAAISVLWAAQLEISRRSSKLLAIDSECASAGVHMSSLPAWYMVGPYAAMGIAEVYVNPALYYLSYSQTPLRLRSTAQAVCLLMGAVSTGLFTLLTPVLGHANDLNHTHLENGYYASIALAFPFLCLYLMVQLSFVEKEFDNPCHTTDDSDAEGPQLFKEIAYQKLGFFKDFPSPSSSLAPSPASSPWNSPPDSPTMSPKGSPWNSTALSAEEHSSWGGQGETNIVLVTEQN